MTETQATVDDFDDLSENKREILRLVAEKGTREMVLWELAADGRDFCGVEFVAQEYGISDAPLDEQVEAFVQDMESHMDSYRDGTDFDHLEATYGHLADAAEETAR